MTDHRRLITELLLFPERNHAASAAATVLAGPSPWLRDAVFKVAPAQVHLSSEAVKIEDGVAIVGLTDQVLNATMEERGVLAVEMEHTLTRLANVHAVELQSGAIPLELHSPLPDIDREPVAPGTLMEIGRASCRESVEN